MAGIFANIDSDIRKLQRLKQEIENVKEALKSINVKVDIDIAKGMEAQLKSLMRQYDALVNKVSEAEGKIMLSTRRINDTSEKIIKAQEQLSKAAGMNPQSGSGNVNTPANNAETASVQAQAKAYDELKQIINETSGSLLKNVNAQYEVNHAIGLYSKELKEIEKTRKSRGKDAEYTIAESARIKQLTLAIEQLKIARSDASREVRTQIKIHNAATGSLNELRQELIRMKDAYADMSAEMRNSSKGANLIASIQQAHKEISEIEQSMGVFSRNVGNYASGFNGLNMSVQQIVRELPSAAMGLNTFFLAISNNIPVLADEIKRAKAANEELKASGKKGIPIWKQVASSLFSWQSALIVGITLLTTHGDKVGEWVSSLFKAKDDIAPLSAATSELNKYIAENNNGYGNSIATLNKLQSKWKELDGDLSKQKTFIYENRDAFSELGVSINDVNDAEKILSSGTDQFIKTLDLRAKAAAAYQLAIKKAEEAFQHGIAADEILQGGANIWDYWNASVDVLGNLDWAIQGGNVFNPGKYTEGRAGKELMASDKAKSTFDILMKLSEKFSKEREERLKGLGVTDNEQAKLKAIAREKLKREADEQRKQQERLSEELLSLRRKNQQDEINLMEDGTEKKLAQIDLDYQKELDAIRKQEQEWTKANGGKLTQEQFIQISLSYSQAESKRDKSISDLNKEKLESDKKAWQEYFIEFGNYQEKRKNLVQKYDDEIAKLHTDSPEYAIKVAEKNQAVEQLDEQFGHSAKAMADLFEDAGNKSVSAIQTIIDKYETLVKYMSGTKESDGTNVTLDELKALGFTDKDIEKIEKGEISIKDVTDAIRGLKDELKGKSPWQAFVSDLEKGIEAIKKGGNDSKKVGQGITDIGNAVTSFAPALGEFGTNIANIFGASDSAITGITDALGGLGTTAAGVGQIMSGDIVGGAMSAVSGVSSVVSALDGLFGADYSHYNEMVEQYSLLNDIWDELIDKKLEYINTSYGAEANKVGEEALELAEKSIESYRILGKERLNAGSSAGSHSIGVRIRKGMSEQGWEEARKALNDEQWFKEISTGRMESLFDLSTEQLERLKSEAPTFWAKLDEDVRNYLDKIIDGEERIEEIHNQINEQLTQTTFDGVYNNFIDTLMDMKASSKDAAEDISEYFMRAMLSEQIGTLYQDKLKKWYEKFAKGMEDGSLTESERNALDAEYMGYIEEAMKLRDELAAATGYDKISQESTSQSASSKGFQTMSQDTGEELNGRFTALQIAGEEIKNQSIIQSQSLNLLTVKADALLSINTETRNIADDTRDLIAQSYLELVQISENTGNSAKYLKEIKADIAEVKRNTSKL
ncbi:hypothetical protein [Phocaeicola massiliensis]|jgi:hypothetical protein|uniref:Tail tape measure protein n=1 Tax=Siphoviridae sp. ctvBz3 TaxID=2825720 RepID=A0A8S5TXH4_9CAUD|nr:hypothetical protein [Phocaeicola massiliensis]DAF86896.1 MAG TPA: tail tape measure protein [Siphoviridae sp. ctvBz3]